MCDDFILRLQSFERLGKIIGDFLNETQNDDLSARFVADIKKTVYIQSYENKWFTIFFIRNALKAVMQMLEPENLIRFKEKYHSFFTENNRKPEKIAVISAGNIPLAAFHDFFSVLVSGNQYIGKLSSQDKILLPQLAKILKAINPFFQDRISFVDRLTDFDKVIATGSDNSARYFDYYFSRYPLLLRKNRNSIAILTGKESEADLMALSDDICLYYGLGCRSVSKIYIPQDYDFAPILQALAKQNKILEENNAYLCNLEYQKAILLMNSIPFYDAGAMILTENSAFSSPISVLYYQKYRIIEDVLKDIDAHFYNIQCVVAQHDIYSKSVSFGKTQFPSLFDYPDEADIVNFCLS